jgi:HTH-like domain
LVERSAAPAIARKTISVHWGMYTYRHASCVADAAHEDREREPRRVTDDTVKTQVARVFGSNYRVYGLRKLKAALRREHGINLDKVRIVRLMRELGIRGATRTKSTVN